MTSILLIGLALGMRHGTDPDHLTAIDGLCRLRPRATNGLYFALGHGVVVTLLAVGIGGVISDRIGFLGPWLLIAIGTMNLWRVFRPARLHTHAAPKWLIARPFILGMILAAGFETASQLAALILTNQAEPVARRLRVHIRYGHGRRSRWLHGGIDSIHGHRGKRGRHKCFSSV